MRINPKLTGRILLIGLAMVPSALAQDRLQTSVPPAATGPSYDVSAGFNYIQMSFPGAGHVNMDGVAAGASVDFTRHFGAAIGSDYARASVVPGTPHDAYLLTLQGGPVFYPLETRRSRMFVHALAGPGLVDGAVPISATKYFHGWAMHLSYAFGGGIQQSVSRQLALRVTGDYLFTSFYGPAGGVEPQNNLRLTVSLVCHLGQRGFGDR
jgi:hypothetical protein